MRRSEDYSKGACKTIRRFPSRLGRTMTRVLPVRSGTRPGTGKSRILAQWRGGQQTPAGSEGVSSRGCAAK